MHEKPKALITHMNQEEETYFRQALGAELSLQAIAGPLDTQDASLRRLQRWWQTIKRNPIPFGSLILLVGGLILWLAGHPEISHWLLLAVVLLGGLPLAWDT